MTNRIRSHILEERSLAFLRDLFPDSWVVHHFSRDYGIDIQVEVFTENGDRTGIRFYGQVKATDKPVDDDILRLSRSHLKYWANHTDPVALFRYFDATKELRWCWLHEVDWLIKPSGDSLDVAGLLKTWEADSSLVAIERYLHARRQALFNQLTPPYEISVELHDANSSRAPLIAAKIAREIESKSFRVLPKELTFGHFQVVIAADKIASSYCGLPGVVFHSTVGMADCELVDRALLATFLCACRYERILFARSLATLSAPLLYRAAGEHLAIQFFDAMIFALGLKTSVEIITPLIAASDNQSSIWLVFSASCAASSWRYGEAHSWSALLQQWLEKPPFAGNAGTFAYNLGNSLSHQGRWDEACVAYAAAIASDPCYDDRPYFWEEFGAAHFERGTIEDASRCYERSLSLSDNPDTRWRLGDTLFHQGQYARAHEHLRCALPELNSNTQGHVQLLMLACVELREVWQLKNQILCQIPEADHERLTTPGTLMSKEDAVSYLHPAIAKNAIDGHFNFNAGVFAKNNGHHSIAAYRFLCCALKQRGDAEAWTNTVLSALNANDVYLAVLSAKAAHFFLDEDFLPWIQGSMPNSPIIPDQISESWRSLMSELVDMLENDRPSDENSPTLRIHSAAVTKQFRLGGKK